MFFTPALADMRAPGVFLYCTHTPESYNSCR